MIPRKNLTLLTLAITLPTAILTGLSMGRIFTQSDALHYIALAQGRPAMLPFASRQLAPLIVRAFARILPLHAAFYVEGVAALLILAAAIALLLARTPAPAWLIPAVLGLFFFPQQFNWLAFPDLLAAALLACFLLALCHRRLALAALLLFPLTLTRESNLLTVLCFLLSLFWPHTNSRHSDAGQSEGKEFRYSSRTRVQIAALAVASSAAALLLVHHLTRNALPNREHLSPTLYLLAKLPWNFLKNLLGLTPWSNLYPACPTPRWQHPLHLGPLRAIGLCGWDFDYPIRVLASALAAFGLFPLLLLRVLHDCRRVKPGAYPPAPPPRAPEMLLRFALLYGALSFLLAPLLGELFARLFAYAWPLFLVALPILLTRSGSAFNSTRAAALFVTLHLALSWTEIYLFPGEILIVAAVLYPMGWLLLRRTWQTPENNQLFPTNASAKML